MKNSLSSMTFRRNSPGANHYPEDITKEEFNTALVHGKPASEVAKAQGYFYAIRRDSGGKLKVVPYNEEYREFLDPAAKLLREARKATAILDKYANIRPPMKGALDKLRNVPVDIEPIYPLAR